MRVCIEAKRKVWFPFEIDKWYGPIHEVEEISSNLRMKLVKEFEVKYPEFDAVQYQVITIWY